MMDVVGRDDGEAIPVRIEPDDDPAEKPTARRHGHPRAPRLGALRLVRDDSELPIIGPGPEAEAEGEPLTELPRLARHTVTLDDGHTVGVAVCGRGVPLVVVHGFTAEGILYAQSLSRLVGLGFKVIAIDTAGHGGTLGLPTGAQSMKRYSELLGRVLDHLGVRQAVLVGHSMGGRLVTELAAREPERVIAVVLIDAIVGDVWDKMVNVFRVFPPLLVAIGAGLVVDSVSTVPLFRDPKQAAKLLRLVTPTLAGHARRPWRLVGPAISILRSRGTGWMLDKLGQERIPVFAIHGDRDLAIPLATAISAARRSGGRTVVVKKATHSWLLRDPETLPAILFMLMQGQLGTAVLRALLMRGVDPVDATIDDREAAFCDPDSLIAELTPRQRHIDTDGLHRPPRYRFSLLPGG